MRNFLARTGAMLTVIFFSQAIQAVPLRKATFRPQWVPQSQFAGYYVALEKGYYKENSIDLEILPGGPTTNALANVATKKETFGTELIASALVMASNKVPIINIGQIFQTGALNLIALKKSGINSIEQMNKKKVGIWPGLFQIPIKLVAKKYGVKPVYIKQQFSMDQFLNEELDVASAMAYNELYTVLQSGIKESELNIFKFKDTGYNFPEDGIYAHKETCENDPQLCKGFVHASIKGWIYAFEHPNEAVDIVLKAAQKANTGTTKKAQQFQLDEVKKLVSYNDGIKNMGVLKQEDYIFIHNSLEEINEITSKVSFSDFYKKQ